MITNLIKFKLPKKQYITESEDCLDDLPIPHPNSRHSIGLSTNSPNLIHFNQSPIQKPK